MCFVCAWCRPGAPMRPLALQVAIETLEIPRGKMLQQYSFVAVGVFAFLVAGGFAFFQFFGEYLVDCFGGEAEAFRGDWFPNWCGELRFGVEAYESLP